MLAAVACALVAGGAGALALGLEAPAFGALGAVAGVAAAALTSLAFAVERPARPVPRQPEEPAPRAEDPARPQPSPDHPAGRRTSAPGELLDRATGLLDHRYFVVALERRLASARRQLRPVSLVLLELTSRDAPSGERPFPVGDQPLRILAAVARAVLRESDTACRTGPSSVGLLLEETAEEGAVWAAERVRTGFSATSSRGDVGLSVGIASYPAHALEADDLLDRAREAAARSRAKGSDGVEVARADDAAG